MARPAYRAALWALVVIVVASAFATIPLAHAASPNYSLTGYARQPSGAPVPNGVTVDLTSRATGAVYSTTTSGGGGQFSFTTSSTSGALAPGYWGLSVPAVGNASLPSCSPCAILPTDQNPTFAFYNSSYLTSSKYPAAEISGVQALFYNATLSGSVHQGANPVLGGQEKLLDPIYNGLVLYVNTTNKTTGAYGLKVPFGTYVLESIAPGPQPQATNLTKVTISSPTPPAVNPVIQSFLVSGNMRTSSGGLIGTSGNATVYDGYNGYIYSETTAPGGYYALGTYPANFTTGGSQSFTAVLSAAGYSTSAYSFTVAPTSPSYSRNVDLSTLTSAQSGYYNTTLDFSGFNVATGTGSLAVQTVASLGNDTVFENLPNASVGQMWAQLGLDFAHSLALPSTSLSQVYAWENSTGPFFPAVEAGTAINGTGFLGPSASQGLSSETSTCTSGSCGLGSTGTIGLTWSESYTLNGTLFRNSSVYTASFGFRHPTTGGDEFNYTVVLPAGYVLKAGTAVPTNARLVAAGPSGTWNRFVLESLYSPSGPGTFSFQFTKTSSKLTAIVNATVSNFAFSKFNVLNQTNGNYTVVVGQGQNVSFTAIHSLYPSGTNGTQFVWTFGDNGTQTTTNGSGYHTYAGANGALPWAGTLTVTSSGGATNSTKFYVWVGTPGFVTAGIRTNATGPQVRSTSGGTTYLYLNWSTVLKFNATGSAATLFSGGPAVNISVASYRLSAWGGFTTIVQNYSVAKGGSGRFALTNASYQFLGAGSYLSSGVVGGTSVPFQGWQYNLTLTVWAADGFNASTTLVVLVNDTEKPTSGFLLYDANYNVISNKGIVAGASLAALVRLDGRNATDPHNGSISHWYWHVYNTGNSSLHWGYNNSTVAPYPVVTLPVQTTPYTVNLTVTDANGNLGWTTQSLSVTANTTTTPVMYATNLTGPTSLNAGTSYTFWVNVTTKAATGSSAVADNVSVTFYLTSPSGTARTYIAGSPHSVTFYNYTSAGVLYGPVSAPNGVVPSLPWNHTLRAQIKWNPGSTGNYVLYANISAENAFVASTSTTNVASQSITVSPNPTTQLLEYVAIGVAVVAVIGLIIFYYRRRSRGGSTARTSGRSGLERGSKRSDDDEDED